jgi:hypothetical protein
MIRNKLGTLIVISILLASVSGDDKPVAAKIPAARDILDVRLKRTA